MKPKPPPPTVSQSQPRPLLFLGSSFSKSVSPRALADGKFDSESTVPNLDVDDISAVASSFFFVARDGFSS